MKVKEIRQLSTEELTNKVTEFKGGLFSLRFQLAAGQLDNPSLTRLTKRDIACVKATFRECKLNLGKET